MIDPGFLLILIGLPLAAFGVLLVAWIADHFWVKPGFEAAMDWLIRPMGRL